MEPFAIGALVSTIDANRSAKDLIVAKLRSQGSKRRITVTDLLSLKQAFFRRKHPEIVPPLDRQQIMWTGTGFHQLFGAAVSREEYLEQYVELEGVTGRIDIYDDVPTELKTTSNLVEETDLVRKRPSYLEQLGFYCGMVGKPDGRIVMFQRDAPTPRSLAVYRVHFGNLTVILDELRRRRDLLQDAIDRDDPSRLPVCPWLTMQCDYAPVCDCRTSFVRPSRDVLQQVKEVKSDEEAVRQLVAKLAEPRAPGPVVRLTDLVFPRKAFLARSGRPAGAEAEADAEEEAAERLSYMERTGMLSVVREAVRYGVPGDTLHVPVRHGALEATVTICQGLPTLVRSPGLRSVVERHKLPQMFSHYFLRLGFECALTDRQRGRLVLYYKNVESEDARLMVYDVGFRNLEAIKAEALGRLSALELARIPEDLPPCPPWLCRYCDDSARCGLMGL